jgi:glycosyltransferase involved in cell wall biosynthesis
VLRRVAIQLTSTGGFYGAEKTLLELALYLAQEGWDSQVIALEGQGAPELVQRAMDHGLTATAFTAGSRLGVRPLVDKLRTALARYPQAIVHSHGYKPDILLAALRAPRRYGCLATCHSWYSDTLKMKLAERLDKRVLRRFAHVIAVSEEIRSDLIASGVRASMVSMIDNGISVPARDLDARARIRAEFGIGLDEPLIVQIGRLARSKRNDLLLHALARLPATLRARLLLVGEGDQKPALVEQASALGIATHVTFCGYRNDAPRILAAADLLALTSDKEGLPIILLEAMAIGCPIVATAVGAVPTALRHKENAWVVPRNDVESLRQAIFEALTDPCAAQRHADRANRDFLARFSREVMGGRYLEIYERVWNSRKHN